MNTNMTVARSEARRRYPLFDSDTKNRIMFAAGVEWVNACRVLLDTGDTILAAAPAVADERYPAFYTSDNTPFIEGVKYALSTGKKA